MAVVAPSSDRRDGLTHNMLNPKLIKTTIDGLSIEETKEIRKRGLAVPALTKLGILLALFDCSVLLVQTDLVPCILVTFDKEQIVVWRGKDYHLPEDGDFYVHRGLFDDLESKMIYSDESSGETNNQQEYYSSDDNE